jgi:hypothetical protein
LVGVACPLLGIVPALIVAITIVSVVAVVGDTSLTIVEMISLLVALQIGYVMGRRSLPTHPVRIGCAVYRTRC